MLGPLDEVIERGALAERDQESVGIAQRNAQRLLKLVNGLLDFTSMEEGRAAARFAPTDLARLTADLASNFRTVCERGGLALDVRCVALDEPVWVDRDSWEKIVLNLLSSLASSRDSVRLTAEGVCPACSAAAAPTRASAC